MSDIDDVWRAIENLRIELVDQCAAGRRDLFAAALLASHYDPRDGLAHRGIMLGCWAGADAMLDAEAQAERERRALVNASAWRPQVGEWVRAPEVVLVAGPLGGPGREATISGSFIRCEVVYVEASRVTASAEVPLYRCRDENKVERRWRLEDLREDK